MIEQAIVSLLQTHVTLVSNRIYPLVMPQNSPLPTVVYQRISGPRIYSQSGASGLAYPRFQFSCWGTTYASVKAVAEQVRQALSGYRGIVEGVSIQGAFIAGDVDDFEPDTGLYRSTLDFIIWHSEE